MSEHDLPELSPDIESLLASERRAPGAPAASKARVLAGLQAAIDPGHGSGGSDTPAGGTSPAPASGAGPIASGAGATAATKLGLSVGLFLAGAVVGGVTWEAVRPPRVERVVEKVVVEVPVNEPAEVSSPAESPPVPVPAVPAPTPPPRAKPAPPRRTPEPAPTLSGDKALEAERLLITQARMALAKGLADAALEALRAHQRQFPDGQLSEERAAIEVQALMSAGQRGEAEKKAAAFHHTYPRSLLGSAVDAALAR